MSEEVEEGVCQSILAKMHLKCIISKPLTDAGRLTAGGMNQSFFVLHKRKINFQDIMLS